MPVERKLWRLLAQHRPRFTRQHVVGPYILDFACRGAKIAVEIDGSQHLDATGYDGARTAFLEKLGWRVLRFWNSQVAENPEGVSAAIIHEVGVALGRTHPQPSRRDPRTMPGAWSPACSGSREGSEHGDTF